jgi:glucose-6-phosphate 1-dehydrogenase
VKPDSTVETFVALRLFIDSWRWRGVPFYLRAGKSLPATATEITVVLRHSPAIFSDPAPAPNHVRFRVSPSLAIGVLTLVKKPGDEMIGDEVELQACGHSFAAEIQPYEELLDDALHGEQLRFASEAYVEEAWRIVQPVLNNATPVHFYDPGTWGPAEAEALAPPDGGWLNPA